MPTATAPFSDDRRGRQVAQHHVQRGDALPVGRLHRLRPVGCQNYVTAADLRRLELAGVLHAKPVLASTRVAASTGGYTRGLSRVRQQSTRGPRPAAGRRGACRVRGAATGHPQARPPAASPARQRTCPARASASRGRLRAPPSRRRCPSRIPRLGSPDGITDRDYPSGEFVPPVRTDVCSMFARMSRSKPVAAGTTRHQNQVGCHLSSQAPP